MKSRAAKANPIAIALVSMSLLIFVGCRTAYIDGEPGYKGKPLSLWMENLRVCKTEEQFLVASNAIHHIGSNAVPYLLAVLRHEVRVLEKPKPQLLPR